MMKAVVVVTLVDVALVMAAVLEMMMMVSSWQIVTLRRKGEDLNDFMVEVMVLVEAVTVGVVVEEVVIEKVVMVVFGREEHWKLMEWEHEDRLWLCLW